MLKSGKQICCMKGCDANEKYFDIHLYGHLYTHPGILRPNRAGNIVFADYCLFVSIETAMIIL